jgi:uncharacterized membrane protein YedE/YeeE
MILPVVLGLAVGLPLGYALQRGGFCMNTAFRSILFERDLSLFRGYILILLINIVAVNLLYEFGAINVSIAPFFWPAVTIGGLIFGFGMVLAGGCTSGTWYRVGKGMLGSFMALIGFAIGATSMSVGILRPLMDTLRTPVIDIYGQEATLINILPLDQPALKWIIIALIVIGGAVWLLRAPKQKFRIGWGWVQTGLIIGLLSVVSWVASGLTGRDYGLSFTQPTVSLVRFILNGDSAGINWGSYLVLGVPIGALVGAIVSGEFSLRMPEPRRLLQQFGGGIIMGLGASLAGGCNIGHGITGVSALALSSIVATLFTILGVWSMTYLVFHRVARMTTRREVIGESGVKT